MGQSRQLIRVGHSPDPDDAFMFFALAHGRIDTGQYAFRHELADIETLNRRALAGQLELTAISVHAYAYLTDRYVLCTCGASMGEGYGPRLVARSKVPPQSLAGKTIAVPGTLTTAFLVLRLCLGSGFSCAVVPFDQILDAVAAGEYRGRPVHAGLVIHEGQLTYQDHRLELLLDLGRWWLQQTGLPLPLGANAIRKDLGPEAIRDVNRLLRASIQYGLDHRQEALEYAMGFGRGLDRAKTDQFVAMYVNRWTLDFGRQGQQAVAELLGRAHAAGVLPRAVLPEFVRADRLKKPDS
ncbi:MAG: menaquinone biosynthesis family protein [Thermoguttaceae bacterium]